MALSRVVSQIVTGLLSASLVAMTLVDTSYAVSGLPNSSQFGYGARVDIWGQHAGYALTAASGIGIDWIGIEFDWTRNWPERGIAFQLEALDAIMQSARQYQLNVLLSITNPPAWAMTLAGPEPNLTAELVTSLAQRYPDILLAIEPFPYANTVRGWGTLPNPAAYLEILKTGQAALQAIGSPVVLIAAGLAPVLSGGISGDMDDLVFLESLYANGAATYTQIIGLRLYEIGCDPLTAPGGEPIVIRHYEQVRSIMLKYGHKTGLIWITGFSWPTPDNRQRQQVCQGKPFPASPAEQAKWIQQAYRLMKSQLYIGVAFIDPLNPPASNNLLIPVSNALIREDTSLHPVLVAYRDIIQTDRGNANGQVKTFLFKKMVSSIKKAP